MYELSTSSPPPVSRLHGESSLLIKACIIQVYGGKCCLGGTGIFHCNTVRGYGAKLEARLSSGAVFRFLFKPPCINQTQSDTRCHKIVHHSWSEGWLSVISIKAHPIMVSPMWGRWHFWWKDRGHSSHSTNFPSSLLQMQHSSSFFWFS